MCYNNLLSSKYRGEIIMITDKNNDFQNNFEPNQPLLLKNAFYYTETGFKLGHILTIEGKIAAIYPETELPQLPDDAVVYDVAGKHVLPGAIDTHVHVREPGWPEREDFFTGTAAALAGGITTICQMPNTQPTPHDLPSLELTRQAAGPKILCDTAVYAAAGYDNRDQLAVLAQTGICGFKTFLQFSEQHTAEPQYITVQNREELTELLDASAATGLRHFFHCEDFILINRLEQAAHQAGAEDYSFHYKTRPDAAELNAVQQVLHAARKTGAKVGIAHVSTVAAAEAIRRAKADGVDVTCEVCFHHLFFDDSWLDKFGPLAKCNPPLRSAANVAGLWPYLLDGTVDYIGSDHAPHLPAAKQAGQEQVWLAPSGIAHIELLLPMLLQAVNQGKITLERLAELCCINGYKQMGLYPQKGRLAVGADADFTVVDLAKEWTFKSAAMQTKARANATLFDGLPIQGAVEAAIVRGRLMYAGGRVDYQSAGYGQLLHCHQKQEV